MKCKLKKVSPNQNLLFLISRTQVRLNSILIYHEALGFSVDSMIFSAKLIRKKSLHPRDAH